MFHPTVRGTYYEMGYSYGSLLYKHGFRVPKIAKEKLEFGRQSEKEVKRVFPEILEEIRGFAEACHVTYEDMASFMMSIGAFKVDQKCSVFAAFNGSDVVFGRNYDFYYSFKKYTESCLTCPKDAYSSIGHSDVFIGKEDGVNERSLAIAMTGIAEKNIKPGISFVLMIRCVLDRCANVEEGVKIISNAHFSATSNYLLADREGSMAVVEVAPDKVRVRRPERGENFIVCTNHFLHSEMLESESVKQRCWDSVPRYAAINQTIEEQNGKIDFETAQKILSNHSGYVCSHQEQIKLGTLWSIIATLKEPKIFRAEGHPCKTKFKQDIRLNKIIRRYARS
ncbi:choloylglycine hydrolase [Candidatus Bathyarchaeota archaeon]|nr:choloylglycine hydrolase [Candidatus Bathyarchaeota archaeon]